MRQYREWIAGIIVYFVVFAAVYAATGSLIPALALGAVFGAAVGFVLYSVAPGDAELAQYQLDARRRVRSVLRTTDGIGVLAEQVKDEAARQALRKGCDVIRDLLALAQQKDPENIASTTAKVGLYITSVKSAAQAQVEIEAHPDYWPNAADLLSANREGFVDFRDFALRAVQQLNQGEAASLRANLNVLKPMSIPALNA